MKHTFWLGVWVTLALSKAHLAWATTQALTLQAIQKIAIDRSPLIRERFKNSESEQFKVDQSSLYPNPQLLFQLGRVYSGDSQGMSYDVTLSQVIPFPGKKSASETAARYRSKIGELEAKDSQVWTQHGVTLSAIRVASITEIAKHSAERKKRFLLVSDYLRSHPQVSPTQKIEASLIENQIRILERGLLENRAEKAAAEADLNFYIQHAGNAEVQFDWSIDPTRLEQTVTLSNVLEKNTQLMKKKYQVGEAEAHLSKAKKDWLPDFTLGFNYRIEQVSPANRFYAGLLGITLPIWDRGQASRGGALSQLDALQFQSSAYEDQLRRDYFTRLENLRVAIEISKKFPVKLAAELEKKFEDAEREFRRGRISTAVFLAVDSQVHDTLDSIFNSEYKLVEAMSQFQLLTSQPLELK